MRNFVLIQKGKEQFCIGRFPSEELAHEFLRVRGFVQLGIYIWQRQAILGLLDDNPSGLPATTKVFSLKTWTRECDREILGIGQP